jgi:hypothetical protein
LEFESIDDASANAFAEYCLIEPVWEQLGVMPDTSITESRPLMSRGGVEPTSRVGRMVLRAVALLALVGAVASSLPAQAEAAAVSPRWTDTLIRASETSDQRVRVTLSLAVLGISGIIAASMLVGLHRPRRAADV